MFLLLPVMLIFDTMKGETMRYYKLNKKHKDRVFCIIFQARKDLLQLYNAVNNTNYTNEDDLIINTIDDVVYMGMKNDLSFIIGDVLNLYEHQSTYSPNLPLRGFLYFADIYRTIIEPVKKQLYTKKPLAIPFPQYIVFYNGTENQPERSEAKLSDLFICNNPNAIPALECTAVMLNINLGCNRALMEKCRTLKEYAEFIAIIREHLKSDMDYEQAVENAVDQCIRDNILRDVLLKNRAEVIDMILTEYDEEEMRAYLQEEAKKDGFEEGRQKGFEMAVKTFVNSLMTRNLSKEDIISKLMEAFSLTEEEASKYLL